MLSHLHISKDIQTDSPLFILLRTKKLKAHVMNSKDNLHGSSMQRAACWAAFKTGPKIHGILMVAFFGAFPQKTNCFVTFKKQVNWAVVLTKPGFLWPGVLKILRFPLSSAYPAVVSVPVGRPGRACWSPGSCFQVGYIMIVFCLPFFQWAHQFWFLFST